MSDPHTLYKTHQVLQRGIDQGLHLGAQLYISQSGVSHGEGTDLVVGERAPGEPMTADTLMIWLSSSKPITAVALAQLWERGDLDLDDPVARFIPEFAQHGKDRITLRHLLTHTGGIRILSFGWPEAGWDEIIATLCAARPEPRWVLGQTAGYHMASSWFLLGEVIRRVDTRSYSDFTRQEIFEPLGMLNCWVGMPRQRYLEDYDRLGRMYVTESDKPSERNWRREPHVVGCSPGGNGHGPIRELGRFYEMLLAHGTWNERRLLSPQTVEALTTPHRVGLLDKTFKAKLDWGLGFICDSKHYLSDMHHDTTGTDGSQLIPYGYGRHASRRTFGHSGFQSSTGFADPEHGLVVTLVVNGNPGEPRHTERFRDITEAIYEDLGLAT